MARRRKAVALLSRQTVTFLLITLSCVAPLVVCSLVIDSVVGLEQLKNYHWMRPIRHGMVISVVLNTLAAFPFVFDTVRANSGTYAVLMLAVVSVTTFLAYGFFIVAMIGI